MRVPKEREPFEQKSIPTWYSSPYNPDGTWVSTHVMNQDFVAWVGQGRIADRTWEMLGMNDHGIAMMRKRYFDHMEATAAGKDAKSTIRNPNVATCVELPFGQKSVQIEGLPLADFGRYPVMKARLSAFRHLAGQPSEVRRQFVEAMGIAGTEYDRQA